MKWVARLTLALVLASSSAWGMSQSQIPNKFPVPWGSSAGASYIRSIPALSQMGIQNCAASLNDGFPPLTFVPASAGGCPPFGVDFNGIFNQLSAWSRWQAAGVMAPYDSTFSAAIGGYPNGAIIPSATTSNLWWQSTADNNASNPDTGGGNWSGVGYVPTGMISPFGGSVAPPGYLLCYGEGLSTTTYAALFAVVGYTYGGSGATFNAPDLRGRTVYGPDAMGGTPANRITAAGGGFSAVLGAGGGAQNQTLTQGQLPASSYALNGTTQTWNINQGNLGQVVNNLAGGGGGFFNFINIISPTVTITPSGTIGPIGSSQSHPILSPGQVASYIIKY